MPLWSTRAVANVELVETCSRYDVAPLDAPHCSETAVLIAVAPFAGNDRTGVAGTFAAAMVVKDEPADHALVPAVLEALTRQ